jgi:hypothetical protein
MSFDKFVRFYLEKMHAIGESHFDLEDAVDLISRHRVETLKKTKVPVFIFIDEHHQIAKSCREAGKLDPDDWVFSSMISALHSPGPRTTVMISTLDYMPVLEYGSSNDFFFPISN